MYEIAITIKPQLKLTIDGETEPQEIKKLNLFLARKNKRNHRTQNIDDFSNEKCIRLGIT